MPSVIFIIILIVLQLIAGCGDEVSRWPHADFDRNEWKKTPEEYRYVLVRSLMGTGKLIGSSRDQISVILGTPSFEDASQVYQTYVIRADKGSVWLLDLRFENKQGKKVVAKAFVRVD